MDNIVKNINEFLGKVTKISDKQLFYRGQGKIEGDILPSVFRNGMQGEEDEIYIETLTECSSEFDTNMTHIDILSKMQHYGVPTRLLDVTTNPLVALYFACNSDIDDDGVMYIFKPKKENIKKYDSDTVTILSSLPRFSKDDKNKIKQISLEYNQKKCTKSKIIKNFNKSDDVIKRLLHEIKKEKPAFENIINPKDLLESFVVIPQKNNPRIIRQSGAFILYGLGGCNMEYEKIIIDKDCKENIKNELSFLGISEVTLYPELYKFGEHLKKKHGENAFSNL